MTKTKLPLPTVTIEPGLPGVPYTLTAVHATKEGPLGPPGGSPGRYKAVATLHRPGTRLVEERNNSFESGLEGDSHLQMLGHGYEAVPSPSQIILEMQTPKRPHFEVVMTPNKRGFLAKLALSDFQAEGATDARKTAHHVIATALSGMSAHLDTPLRVFQLDVTEIATGTSSMSFVSPFLDVPCSLGTSGGGGDEFRAYASLYRESLNANSVLYQFLCLYKITEGIRKKRISKERVAKKANMPYVPPPPEVVPVNVADFVPWLNSIFPVAPAWTELRLVEIFRNEARGRRFSDLLGDQKVLTNLRNKIGHAFSAASADNVVNLDDVSLYDEVSGWLSLLKCMARRMMRNEFPNEFLANLTSKV